MNISQNESPLKLGRKFAKIMFAVCPRHYICHLLPIYVHFWPFFHLLGECCPYTRIHQNTMKEDIKLVQKKFLTGRLRFCWCYLCHHKKSRVLDFCPWLCRVIADDYQEYTMMRKSRVKSYIEDRIGKAILVLFKSQKRGFQATSCRPPAVLINSFTA